jgi:hypothetical protein
MITFIHNSKILSPFNTFNNQSTTPPDINKGGLSYSLSRKQIEDQINLSISKTEASYRCPVSNSETWDSTSITNVSSGIALNIDPNSII